MKNQKGISLIALIITIIVIIILAAIVIVRAMGTIDSANKAKFDQEFTDFQQAVVTKGLDIYAKIITAGYTTDSADYFYMAARNLKVDDMLDDSDPKQFKHLSEDANIAAVIKNTSGQDSDNIVEIKEFANVLYNNKTYEFPKWKLVQEPASGSTSADDVNGDGVIYCYKIDSTNLEGYMNANKPSFHGKIGSNNNSTPNTVESHWITESGKVFTYPGYFYDGNLYITNEVYSTGS